MTIQLTPEEDAGVLLTDLADQVSTTAAHRRDLGIRVGLTTHAFQVAGLLSDIAAALLDPEVDVVFVPRSERPVTLSDKDREILRTATMRRVVRIPNDLRNVGDHEGAEAIASETGQTYKRIGDGWAFNSGPVTSETLAWIPINVAVLVQ